MEISPTPEEPSEGEIKLDERAFETVFKNHFKSLHAYAQALVKDSDSAEEIVQTVFLKLWEKKDTIQINVSLKAYLYKTVYNDSMNYLRHQKVKMKHWEHQRYEMDQNSNQTNFDFGSDERELSKRIDRALGRLPAKCREVFELSRFEELKYQEIANRMGISIKTVEAHMGKALKTLRTELTEFLPILFVLFSNLL